MKKSLFGMIAIASMAIVGCTQEVEQLVMDDMKNVEFTGMIEDMDTRTSMDNTGKVIWCKDDPVSIFMRNGNHYKYQSKSGGTANTTFAYASWYSKGSATLDQNYAVYPFDEDNAFDATTKKFTIDLSGLAEQTYTENNFEEGKSVMTAKASDTNLPFYNALSVLKVRLNSDVPEAYCVTEIKIESETLALNGTGATIDMTATDGKAPAVLSSGGKINTLKCEEGVVIGGDYTDFYILVPANEVKADDFTITVTARNEFTAGETYTMKETISKDFTFGRSEIVTYERTLTADDWTGVIEGEYNEASGLFWNGNSAAHKSVYYIYNASDLKKAASYFYIQQHSSEANKVTFDLKGDIDMAGIDWEPWSVMFITLNANNYTISNLSNSLFGYAGAVTINELTLENVTATGNQAGTFAASAEGTTMTDCSLKGNNSVTYVDASKNENGVGAITGVCVQCDLNVTIETGTSVMIDMGNIADTEKTTFENILYGYKHTTYATNSGTITNNGEITCVVSTAADLSATLVNGDNVVLTDNLTISGTVITTNGVTEAYGNKVGVAQYGGTFDGNNKTLTETGDNAYVIVTHGGTIKNLTIVGGGRGIVIYAPTEDVIIDNVVIDGPGYAINTAEHNGQNLIVTNSTIKGWTSLAGLYSVSFTDCLFGENTTKYWQNMGYVQDYDRLVKPYGNATFTDCTFEQNFYIDLSALGGGCTITLAGCVCNDVEITAENYASYISIELPSGRTLNDCVVFN